MENYMFSLKIVCSYVIPVIPLFLTSFIFRALSMMSMASPGMVHPAWRNMAGDVPFGAVKFMEQPQHISALSDRF